jgi:hypothetical protein
MRFNILIGELPEASRDLRDHSIVNLGPRVLCAIAHSYC